MKKNITCLIIALAFVSSAQAATVTLDGTTATGINNLFIPGLSTATPGLYNVTFSQTSADSLYGDPFVFDFTTNVDAGEAMEQTNDALNLSIAETVGASALDSFGTYYLGYAFDETFPTRVSTINSLYNPSENWITIGGAEGIDRDAPLFYASYELVTTPNPVPVPAAVWLFGTALVGFIGLSRRRKVA
jgi:hypothetical protein